MLKFDRTKFLKHIEKQCTPVGSKSLIKLQIDGVNQLLDYIEADARWTKFAVMQAKWILAYFFATIAHECKTKMTVGGRKTFVSTFNPIVEMGGDAYLNRKYDTRTDLGNTAALDGDGAKFGGKGYVQNTGKTNAGTTGKTLRGLVISLMDLPVNPAVHAAFLRASADDKYLTINETTFIREPMLLLVPKVSYLDAVDGMFTGRYTGKKITDYITPSKSDLVNARRVINRLDKADEIAAIARLMFTAINESVSFDQAAAIKPQPAPTVIAPEPTDINVEPTPTPNQPTEVTSTNTTVTPAGETTTAVTAKNEQDVNSPVVIEKKKYGMGAKLKTDLAALLGGNVSIEGIRLFATNVAQIPLSPEFWQFLFYAALVVTAIWLIYRVFDWIKFYVVQHKENKLIAQNNADPIKRDIYIVETGTKK